MRQFQLLFFLLVILYSCDSVKSFDPSRDFSNIEKDLQAQFILAENNSVIEIEEGHFVFSKSLILDGKENITVRGKGIEKTVLSFKNQKEGAEGDPKTSTVGSKEIVSVSKRFT